MLNERIKHCFLSNLNLHFEGCELWLVVLEADNVIMNTRHHLVTMLLCALPPQAHPKACSWHQGFTSHQCGLQPLCAEQLSTPVTASLRQTQTFSHALQGTLTMGKQMHIQLCPKQTGISKPISWMEASKRPWRSCRELNIGHLLVPTFSCFNFHLFETPPSTWHAVLQCHDPLLQGTPHSSSMLQRCTWVMHLVFL